MNRRNAFSKACGSSMRKTRLNVSWLGTPWAKTKTVRKSPLLVAANNAMSQQVWAPHSVAKRAINKISVRSCTALSARGSGRLEKHRENRSIGISLQIERHLQNPILFGPQYLIQPHMRFPCLQGEGRPLEAVGVGCAALPPAGEP